LIRENLLTGRLFSLERLQSLLTRLPDGLEESLKGFVLGLEDVVPCDYYPELHTNAYFLRIAGSRYGFFTEIMASLGGMEERRGFRDYRLFEFTRTIPNEIKGSRSRGTPRQLIKTAFKSRLPHLMERTDNAAAPGDFRSVPSVQPAFLALAGRAGETGLLRQEGVDRLTERYLADPLSSAGERFRAVVLFLAWHAFYIEGRDPFLPH
jgi:hypothetical protein